MAVGIVAASLALAGVLTWALVRQLEFDSAQDQLAKNALVERPQVAQLECAQHEINSRTGLPTSRCVAGVGSESQFLDNVTGHANMLSISGDRIILLDRPRLLNGRALREPQVLYDSEGRLPPGTPVPLGRETRVAGQPVHEGSATLDGQRYLIAATPLANRFASWVVLARRYNTVAAQATSRLVPPILLSGGAGLLLALVVTFLLSRTMIRPLHELRRAAEDIAGGNYSRRVAVSNGDEIGVVGQAFNRMAEAVERARSQQRSFLANVSHELKTPLTSLIGFSQALMDGSLTTDEEKMRAASILHEESRRVLRMSQELLDLARVESGQLTFNPQPVDLGAQLQQELEIVRGRARARRLDLELALPPGLPPVRADPDRLHQILENLLDNAVKYAPEGTAVLISAAEWPGDRIATAVTNQVGSRAPDPDRMFDRFYRGDPSRSSAAGGVGLGLAISRELAAAQNGRLAAHLDRGRSLTVRLDLPAARPPTALARAVRRENGSAPNGRRRPSDPHAALPS